jgi:hypothetical protein
VIEQLLETKAGRGFHWLLARRLLYSPVMSSPTGHPLKGHPVPPNENLFMRNATTSKTAVNWTEDCVS